MNSDFQGKGPSGVALAFHMFVSQASADPEVRKEIVKDLARINFYVQIVQQALFINDSEIINAAMSGYKPTVAQERADKVEELPEASPIYTQGTGQPAVPGLPGTDEPKPSGYFVLVNKAGQPQSFYTAQEVIDFLIAEKANETLLGEARV